MQPFYSRFIPAGRVFTFSQGHTSRVELIYTQIWMSAPVSLSHISIAEIPEDKLVGRLLADPLWGIEFFHFAGMPAGMVNRQGVSLATAPGNPEGDIDVLFSAPESPEQAVAYQVKRIKFGINQLRNGTPNKLGEFKKLSQQANLLARMGFWQVYADVIVVVDAREQNAGKVTYEGLSSKMRSLVYSFISSSIQLLDERVGLGVMDFIQPMDYAPFEVGTHGLHVRRFATPTKQSEELTKWVAGVFLKPA
jgi:hypothetical protein